MQAFIEDLKTNENYTIKLKQPVVRYEFDTQEYKQVPESDLNSHDEPISMNEYYRPSIKSELPKRSLPEPQDDMCLCYAKPRAKQIHLTDKIRSCLKFFAHTDPKMRDNVVVQFEFDNQICTEDIIVNFAIQGMYAIPGTFGSSIIGVPTGQWNITIDLAATCNVENYKLFRFPERPHQKACPLGSNHWNAQV